MSDVSCRLSVTPTTRYPWKMPSWESMDIFRSDTLFSFEIMEEMLATMPMSSLPITRRVAGRVCPDFPLQSARITR